MNRLDRKLMQFQKASEIAKDIVEDAEGFLFVENVLRQTSGQSFELVVDSALLELAKKATALRNVFSADYDPEGRVCSICKDNPCFCSVEDLQTKIN